MSLNILIQEQHLLFCRVSDKLTYTFIEEFRMHLIEKTFFILISLKFVSKDTVHDKSSLIQVIS